MSHIVDCTGKAFVGLTNPYTGEPMKVKMLVQKDGVVKFFAPATYTTFNRFGTPKAAYAAWNRSEGIEGAKTGGEIVCAYTGEKLTPKKDETGCYFDGGFDPRRFYTRSEFLHYAWMRGGKSPYAVEDVASKVEPVLESDSLKVKHHEIELTDESMTRAGDAMAKSGFAPEKKTVVSMSVPKKARK